MSFAKVDIEGNEAAAKMAGITSVPTFKFFKVSVCVLLTYIYFLACFCRGSSSNLWHSEHEERSICYQYASHVSYENRQNIHQDERPY